MATGQRTDKVRTCSHCGVLWDGENFYLRKTVPYSRCKTCWDQYIKEWRTRPENYERVKKQARDHAKAKYSPELYAGSEKQQRDRERYKTGEHKEKKNAARRAKWAENIEESRQAQREHLKQWRTENPDKHREKVQRDAWRRRARKASVLSDFTKQDWLEILPEWEYRCAYCGDLTQLEIDHVIPISKGGPDTRSNIVPACASCNRSKNNRDLLQWLDVQFFGVTTNGK